MTGTPSSPARSPAPATRWASTPAIPVTPAEIADSAIEAARAGAAVVHIHVGTPRRGGGARDPASSARRWSGSAGPGPTWSSTSPPAWAATWCSAPASIPPPRPGRHRHGGAARAAAHVEELRPEICTLDCGTMNFAEGRLRHDQHPFHPPRDGEAGEGAGSAAGARGLRYRAPGVREADGGRGSHRVPSHGAALHGIPYGAPDDPGTLLAMVNQLPPGTRWSAFSIGRMQLPYVAMAVLAGGNVRVGLEDNLYLERGVYASNADLVTRAGEILRAMNVRVLAPPRSGRPSSSAPRREGRRGDEGYGHRYRRGVRLRSRQQLVPAARPGLPTVLVDCGYQIPERSGRAASTAGSMPSTSPIPTRTTLRPRPPHRALSHRAPRAPAAVIGHSGVASFVRGALDLGYPGMRDHLPFPLEFVAVSPARRLDFGRSPSPLPAPTMAC